MTALAAPSERAFTERLLGIHRCRIYDLTYTEGPSTETVRDPVCGRTWTMVTTHGGARQFRITNPGRRV